MKKRLVIVPVSLAGLVIVLAIAAQAAAPDKAPLDAAVREASGADFILLADGYTEYELSGPVDGPPVVLVHGFSVPMFDWDPQAAFLADKGYRVLRYNQYGRGLSDRPRIRYDRELFDRQLAGLIVSRGWDRVSIVGHSMGAAVAAEYAARHPDNVDRVVLVAPVIDMADKNAGVALVRIPLAGGFAAKVLLPGIIHDRAAELFEAAGADSSGAWLEAFDDQMRYRGFTRSVKSLFRSDMSDDFSDTYRKLDAGRTMMIRGTRDESVSAEHAGRIMEAVGGMRIEIFEGVGHMPNLEAADRTNALLAEFLSP